MTGGIRRRIATAAFTLALVACSGDAPEPAGTPGEVPNERVSRDNALPNEFPDDFPIPTERTVLYSAVSPVGVVVYFTSAIKGEVLTSLILAGLESGDWTLHSCLRSTGGPEPVTTIVASKNRTVATAVVGYSPQAATRIEGRIYTFFVSVATDADAPVSQADSC